MLILVFIKIEFRLDMETREGLKKLYTKESQNLDGLLCFIRPLCFCDEFKFIHRFVLLLYINLQTTYLNLGYAWESDLKIRRRFEEIFI